MATGKLNMSTSLTHTDVTFHPLAPDRWSDLETLFGNNGAYGGCWCMWWRTTRSDFGKQGNEGNRQALKAITEAGEVPGVLAYIDTQPVGWCSVAPREAFPSLDRSRTLKRVDDLAVWSVVCFYVTKPYRRQGMMTELLLAAIDYAREHGARIIEGYPIDPKRGDLPPVSSFTGILSVFQEVGFVEVARRSEKRPIMRYVIEKE
jgi:GNAT superfamily N-acetyltransferase